jgi:hypothetical protein
MSNERVSAAVLGLHAVTAESLQSCKLPASAGELVMPLGNELEDGFLDFG